MELDKKYLDDVYESFKKLTAKGVLPPMLCKDGHYLIAMPFGYLGVIKGEGIAGVQVYGEDAQTTVQSAQAFLSKSSAPTKEEVQQAEEELRAAGIEVGYEN